MFSARLWRKNRDYSPFQVQILFLGRKHLRSLLPNALKGFVWLPEAIKVREGHFTHAGFEKQGLSLLLMCGRNECWMSTWFPSPRSLFWPDEYHHPEGSPSVTWPPAYLKSLVIKFTTIQECPGLENNGRPEYDVFLQGQDIFPGGLLVSLLDKGDLKSQANQPAAARTLGSPCSTTIRQPFFLHGQF